MLFAFIYCGCDWRRERTFIEWANALPAGLPRDLMVFISENLCVFPNAGNGLIYQIQHNFRGHGVYILGDWFPRAVWYYFPVALAIKLSIPVLLLIVVALGSRPRSYAGPFGLLVLTLFLFTLNCRVQIGIRLILPFVTLLMVWLAVVVTKTSETLLPESPRRVAFAAVCLLLVMPAFAVWPHGLCYANRIWGGPRETHRYLSDSNSDWGQGLKDLSAWESRHGNPPMKIWYFGADPAIRKRSGNLALHSVPLATEEDFIRQVRGSYLAVGATILDGQPSPTPSAAVALRALKRRKPVARTMTFFIFDFTEPALAARAP
jgi:hypothetical protein